MLFRPIFLSGFALSLLGCAHFYQLFESEESRLERTLRPALARHTVQGEEFDELIQIVDEAGRLVLGGSWQGTNAAPDSAKPMAFIVDASALAADPQLCSADSHGGMACARAHAIRDNCAVVAPRTMACDVYFLWRIERTAYRLAVGSLKEPGPNGRYYFDRDNLRRQCFPREEALPSISQMKANLHDLRAVIKQGISASAAEPFIRVRKGFIEMIIWHELGHIAHKDLGEATAPCANDPSSLAAMCGACVRPAQRELEADRYAIDILKRDLALDTFTPARASPEFWIEEFYRRNYRALKKQGHPLDWVPASESEAEHFMLNWMAEIGTCRHPPWLSRYLSIMEALRTSGIQFTASQMTLKYESETIEHIHKFCAQSCVASTPP